MSLKKKNVSYYCILLQITIAGYLFYTMHFLIIGGKGNINYMPSDINILNTTLLSKENLLNKLLLL